MRCVQNNDGFTFPMPVCGGLPQYRLKIFYFIILFSTQTFDTHSSFKASLQRTVRRTLPTMEALCGVPIYQGPRLNHWRFVALVCLFMALREPRSVDCTASGAAETEVNSASNLPAWALRSKEQVRELQAARQSESQSTSSRRGPRGPEERC